MGGEGLLFSGFLAGLHRPGELGDKGTPDGKQPEWGPGKSLWPTILPNRTLI